MKHLAALLVGALLAADVAGANALPAITTVVVAVDEAQHRIVVSYDLSDAEGEACEVVVNLSADGGVTYAVSTAGVTGDGRGATWAFEGTRVVHSHTDVSSTASTATTASAIRLPCGDAVEATLADASDRTAASRSRGRSSPYRATASPGAIALRASRTPRCSRPPRQRLPAPARPRSWGGRSGSASAGSLWTWRRRRRGPTRPCSRLAST